MSVLDAIASALLPPAAARALQLAEELPAAVEAARAVLDEHGPLVALRAFASQTSGRLDDATVAELERYVTTALSALDKACDAGVWLSEHEPAIRGAVDATFAAVFGAAYRAAAWRDTLRHWSSGRSG